MFGNRIRLRSLALLCRSLATLLSSGVEIRKAFQVAAGKSGDPRARAAMEEVNLQIARGEDVTSAMRAQGGAFPELLIDMVDVAEQTGTLPEILHRLSHHYDSLVRMRKNFLRQIAGPAIQLVAAILIITLLILILGWIAESNPNAVDTLGFGLMGPAGAVIWLTLTFGTLAAVLLLYFIAAKSFDTKRAIDLVLLKIPVIGECMRSFAIARFSWAFALTQQAGMPIEPSVKASLKATGNGAFQAEASEVWRKLREGETLTEALAATHLFPADYIQLVDVGETSGTVPETLDRLSPEFEEQARRSLAMLASALGWAVWVLVAVFIIFVIFSIVLTYVGMINELAR